MQAANTYSMSQSVHESYDSELERYTYDVNYDSNMCRRTRLYCVATTGQTFEQGIRLAPEFFNCGVRYIDDEFDSSTNIQYLTVYFNTYDAFMQFGNEMMSYGFPPYEYNDDHTQLYITYTDCVNAVVQAYTLLEQYYVEDESTFIQVNQYRTSIGCEVQEEQETDQESDSDMEESDQESDSDMEETDQGSDTDIVETDQESEEEVRRFC